MGFHSYSSYPFDLNIYKKQNKPIAVVRPTIKRFSKIVSDKVSKTFDITILRLKN